MQPGVRRWHGCARVSALTSAAQRRTPGEVDVNKQQISWKKADVYAVEPFMPPGYASLSSLLFLMLLVGSWCCLLVCCTLVHCIVLVRFHNWMVLVNYFAFSYVPTDSRSVPLEFSYAPSVCLPLLVVLPEFVCKYYVFHVVTFYYCSYRPHKFVLCFIVTALMVFKVILLSHSDWNFRYSLVGQLFSLDFNNVLLVACLTFSSVTVAAYWSSLMCCVGRIKYFFWLVCSVRIGGSCAHPVSEDIFGLISWSSVHTLGGEFIVFIRFFCTSLAFISVLLWVSFFRHRLCCVRFTEPLFIWFARRVDILFTAFHMLQGLTSFLSSCFWFHDVLLFSCRWDFSWICSQVDDSVVLPWLLVCETEFSCLSFVS